MKSLNPGLQNTFLKNLIFICICTPDIATVQKFGVNIIFCNNLEKFIGQKNKKFTPNWWGGEGVLLQNVGFWNTKE